MLGSLASGRDLELSVMMVGDETMRRLNLEYLGRNEPTDVMAFPQAAPEEIGNYAPGAGQPELLGDIVICVPTARQQARERGEPLIRELELLAAHGLLHLFGYGDSTPDEKRVMYAMESKLLGRRTARTSDRRIIR
ncbi:MAG: rRNA maturation RNase YbeY [Actinobacteria bacterium]|nr:rRNA maturation RNase YbeY [Actinomycetota bacterium]MCG2819391.1 rRNA maturation RNase YbeY [Actinomycetes bacterium]MBU4179247.1 rRNA maturation RNase YbeY [Actinomycetota bacterium]MBU4219095.1 rRNA maturation RNase YbeY [Actinomycetota bacterium]MBU4358382.1 rRNA maturation RNase YbeY [Actinomycetota bacterium]